MYKPEITKKSADLARSNRLKFHADEEKHDIVAVIYAREVVKQALNQTKAEEMLRQKQETELAECTFKPKIQPVFNIPEPTHGDRNHDLHSKIKMGAFTAKHDKDAEEFEYERNFKECNHRPTINGKILPSERSLNEIIGADKKIKQMKAGQEQSLAQKAVQDRYGIVQQQKNGSKVVTRQD